MKTYLLVGLVKNTRTTGYFPKPLITVQAETIEAAAAKIGGHLHDAGPCKDQPFSAIFAPDVTCATFRGSPQVGEAIARAMMASASETPPATDVDAIVRGSQSMLKMFERLLLGEVPALV
jgi:hypothetical protein